MDRAWILAALLALPAGAAAQERPAAATPPPASAPGAPAGEVRGALPPPRVVPLPDEGTPARRGTVLVEVTGTVRAVDHARQLVTIDTAAGPVTLSMDRNTLVYGPSGLGTVLDLTPGSPVRAGRNADMVAYWFTVRPPAAPPPSPTPGQGTGPGGGAGPPPGGEGRAPAEPGRPGPGGASPAGGGAPTGSPPAGEKGH